MKSWLPVVLLCGLAATLFCLVFQFRENHIDKFAHGIEHRDVYGDPFVEWNVIIVDYACINASKCPYRDSKIVTGLYPRFELRPIQMLIFGVLIPTVMLLVAAFIAGRTTVRRK
jgi:hypothetical protein